MKTEKASIPWGGIAICAVGTLLWLGIEADLAQRWAVWQMAYSGLACLAGAYFLVRLLGSERPSGAEIWFCIYAEGMALLTLLTAGRLYLSAEWKQLFPGHAATIDTLFRAAPLLAVGCIALCGLLARLALANRHRKQMGRKAIGAPLFCFLGRELTAFFQGVWQLVRILFQNLFRILQILARYPADLLDCMEGRDLNDEETELPPFSGAANKE